jgi:hypothetical protein
MRGLPGAGPWAPHARVAAAYGERNSGRRRWFALTMLTATLVAQSVYLYERAADASAERPDFSNDFGFVDLPLLHQQLRFDAAVPPAPVVRLSLGTPRAGLSVGLDLGAAASAVTLRSQSVLSSRTLLAHHADSRSYSDNNTELAFASGTTAPRSRYGAELFAAGFPLTVRAPAPLTPFEFAPAYPTDGVAALPPEGPVLGRWSTLHFSGAYVRLRTDVAATEGSFACEATRAVCRADARVLGVEARLHLAPSGAADEIVVRGSALSSRVRDACRDTSYDWLETLMDVVGAEAQPTYAHALVGVWPLAEEAPALWVRTRELCGRGSTEVVFETTGASELQLPWSSFLLGARIVHTPSGRKLRQLPPLESAEALSGWVLVLVVGAMVWRVNLQTLPPLEPYEELYRARLPEAYKVLAVEAQVVLVSAVVLATLALDSHVHSLPTGLSNADQQTEQAATLLVTLALAAFWWAWALLVTSRRLPAAHLDRVVGDSWRRFFVGELALQATLAALPAVFHATAGTAAMAFVYLLSMHVTLSTLLAVLLAPVSGVMMHEYHAEVLPRLAGLEGYRAQSTEGEALLMWMWVVSILALMATALLDFTTGLLPLCGTFFPGNGSVFVFMALVFVLFSATADAKGRVDVHRRLLRLAMAEAKKQS